MADVERLRQELEQKTGESLAKIKELNERLIADKIFAVRGAYSQFLERHPDHLRATIAFASFLYDEGETETALRLWRKVLALDPKNAPAHNNLANHYGHAKDWKMAMTEYEAAIALAPTESVYRFNYASVMDLYRKEIAAAGGTTEAEIIRKISKELKTARDLAPAEFGFAAAYAKSLDSLTPPNWEEAVAAWRYCVKLSGNDEERDYSNLNAARVCIELKDKKQASDFIAASTLPASEPMRLELRRRLDALK